MSDSSPNKQLTRAVWLVAIGGALLLAFALWPGRRDAASSASATPSSATHGAGAGGSPGGSPGAGGSALGPNAAGGGAADPLTAAAASSSADSEAARLARMKLRRWSMVSDAIELNRFPPDSRPLTPEMTDVLRPYQRYEKPIPIVRKKGAAGDPEKDPYVLFTGPRYLLTPGTPLQATFEVYARRPKDGEEPQRIDVELIATKLMKFGQPEFTPVMDAPLNDGGQHGDLTPGDRVYTVSIPPASLPAGYNGMLSLTVDFRVVGVEGPVHLALDFQMTSAPPAVFTDHVRERLTPQGLELAVRVDVKQKGNYFTQALLFDSKKKPIGYAISRNAWEPGTKEAVFLFFGLMFHEAKAEPPFVMKTLTGARLAEGSEPFNSEMPPFEGEYWTKSYALSDFSTAEHESAAKDKQIATLTELAEKNPEKTMVPAASGTAPAPPTNGSAKP